MSAFLLNSGLKSDIAPCPKSAMNGNRRAIRSPRGAAKQRHFNAEHLRNPNALGMVGSGIAKIKLDVVQ
jgi:hypothetical protein